LNYDIEVDGIWYISVKGTAKAYEVEEVPSWVENLRRVVLSYNPYSPIGLFFG
jgi:hypothetical protein